MRRARLLLLVVAIVLLQTALFPHLRVDRVVPDLGLVATAAIAYSDGPDSGAIFGFFCGLMVDLFLQTPLGLSALAWGLTGETVGVLRSAVLRATWWMRPVLGLVAGLVGGTLFVVVGTLVGHETLWAVHSVRVVAEAAVYDAVLAPLVFPIAAFAARRDGLVVGTAGTGTGPGPW